MTVVRAQVIGQYYTLNPQDVFTNTWHFSTVSGLTTALGTEIVSKLAAFYNAIDVYLSPVLTTELQVKLFNLDDPEPRNPFEPGWGFPIVHAANSTGLPEEIAACMSLHAALPHTARRRGRLYLGPLADTTLTKGADSTPAEVNPTFRTAVQGAANTMISSNASTPWVIYSQADGIARNVTGGWIDTAWDIQRRRGILPRGRTTFGDPTA